MKTDELKLNWVRIFDPIHIPRELVEQIKGRSFDVDKFYKYQKAACLEEINGKIVLNPLNLLYVLTDESTSVKGFCWMIVDPLSEALVINTFSMNPEFWGNGKAVRILEEKAKEIQEGAQLKKIYWITRSPRHSQKFGFKVSKHTLMEYVGHGRNIHGKQCEASGEGRLDVSPAVAVS